MAENEGVEWEGVACWVLSGGNGSKVGMERDILEMKESMGIDAYCVIELE